MRFNGRLGTDRQGDGHLILVTDPRITNPDEYVLAMQAHWQGKPLGKNVLSKNGLVIVAGSTDGGKSVTWARAFTGMPEGNERLSAAILGGALTGRAMTPQALLALPGDPGAQPTPTAPAVTAANASLVTAASPTPTPSATRATNLPALPGMPAPVPPTPSPSAAAPTGTSLTDVVFGADGYKRVCMKGCGDGDVGYTYLIEQIQPTGGQKTAIVAVGLVMAMLVWVALLMVGIPSPADLRAGRLHSGPSLRERGRTRSRKREHAFEADLPYSFTRLRGESKQQALWRGEYEALGRLQRRMRQRDHDRY